MKMITTIFVALLISLTASAQEAIPTLSPYQQAMHALKEGRYSDVEHWYGGLTKKDKRVPSNLSLATLAATNSYNMELAEERMDIYNGLRLKKEDEKALREQVATHLDKVRRLLSNTRTVGTVKIVSGTLSELLQIIHQQTAHLGVTSATTYITPDGKTKWQVSIDSDSVPAFKMIHKLGNGKWDEDNAETIAIRGLPERSALSYPFLLSDGNTLYFTIEQEGITPPNTLGGKDIYVSRYDRDARVLLVPTQLSLPFNSASDDFAYIVDEQIDFGWLVTSRESKGDTLRLYVFTPSTLARFEGSEGLSDVAMWHNPQLTERSYRAPKGISQEQDRPILFWVGKQAIRSEEDLPNNQAKTVFRQYLQLQQSVITTEEALSTLRRQLQANPRLINDLRIREQALNLEKNLEDYYLRLKAIRNEVIGLSFPNYR